MRDGPSSGRPRRSPRSAAGRPSTACQDGLVVRAARGRYVLPELPDPWLSAAAVAGVVSHTSAARHWGFPLLSRPDLVQVTVARSRSRVAAAGVQLHWSDLGQADRAPGLAVTTPLRTVLDCARTLPLAEALAVADSALRSGAVGRAELERGADRLRGPGARRAGRVAAVADARAESGLESALRAITVEQRLTGFVPQVVVRDGGFRARVDLADERRRIVAEADSFEHHGHRQALVRDCERYDELVLRGWLVLRFAWEHVLFRPDWVAATLVAARRLRDGRPADRRKAA